MCVTIPAQYIKFRRTFRRIIWEISPHKTAQFAFLDKCGAAQFAIFYRTEMVALKGSDAHDLYQRHDTL